MEIIKAAVLDFIQKQDCVSYTEIERIFHENGFDYGGDLLGCSDLNEHVIFWSGWNQEAYNIIAELMREGLICREPAPPIVLLTMGKMLALPLVKSNANYKTDHWLPVMYRPSKGAS